MLHGRFSAEDIDQSQSDIITTLEAARLSPSSTLLLGGAALALAGIRPAHDVDIIVAASNFNEMRRAFSTPGGQPLSVKQSTRRPFLTSPQRSRNDNPLQLDITRPPFDMSDDTFLQLVANNPFHEQSGFHYLPPLDVRDAKLSQNRLRRKDRRDVELINRHVGQ